MIGKNLERLIREKGVSLRVVSRATGISIGTLSKIQSGQEPKATTLHKLSKYLGCSMETLLGDEPPKQPIDELIARFAPEFVEVFKDTFRVTIERKKGK